MKQIFISYAPRDRDYAQALRDELTKIGYRPWVNRDARAGQNWQYAVTEGIKDSAAVVVLLTQSAADSTFVTYEWSLAVGAGVRVIPIIFRGVNAHPHLMVMEQFDFGAYPNESQFWTQFIRELQRMLGDGEKVSKNTENLGGNAKAANETGFFLVVEKQGAAPKRIKMTAESISLGREAVNDIVVDEQGVSRTHLRFVRARNTYQLIDMGSTNGTFMGQDRIDMIDLKPGDTMRIGDKIVLKFEYVP